MKPVTVIGGIFFRVGGEMDPEGNQVELCRPPAGP